MLKNPETNPYPHKFEVTYDDSKFVEEFGHLKSGETAEDREIRIAGRIYNKRASGSKLIFYGNNCPETTLPPSSFSWGSLSSTAIYHRAKLTQETGGGDF